MRSVALFMNLFSKVLRRFPSIKLGSTKLEILKLVSLELGIGFPKNNDDTVS